VPALSLLALAPEREADDLHEERGHLVHVQPLEGATRDLEPLQGVRQLDRNPEALGHRVGQPRHPGPATRAEHPPDARIPRRRLQEGGRALDPDGDLVPAALHARLELRCPLVALEHLLGVVRRQATLPLQVLAELAGADREVAREQRDAILHDVHVRDLVPDVDERRDAVLLGGVVELEGVVERECIHVHDARIEPSLAEQVELGLDQLPLGGHQEHVHLKTGPVRIEHLEVQLHPLDVEGDVLLGLPADDVVGVRLVHPIDLDLLDDHVPAADGHDHALLLDARRDEEALDRLRHHAGVHDLPLDDGVRQHVRDGHLREGGAAGPVIDDRDLDEAAADVEPNRLCLPTEPQKRHMSLGFKEIRGVSGTLQ